MLGKTEGRRRRGRQRIRWLDGITYSILDGHEFDQTPGDGEGQGSLECCSLWGCKKSTGLNDYTTTKTEENLHNFQEKNIGEYL